MPCSPGQISRTTREEGGEDVDKQILEDLAKPLVQYLRENHNPHTSIVITEERVVVVEDVIGIPFLNRV